MKSELAFLSGAGLYVPVEVSDEEEAPMSRVPWHIFKEHQPRAHLLAAVLCTVPTGADPNPREA